jgi:anti-sigma28 factor (negative regulator of flagellin synthesis)
MKIEAGTMSSITQSENFLKKNSPHATPETTLADKTASMAYSVDLSPTTEQQHIPLSPDEISHARVTAIRDQLASGTYNISGKDVANKILGVLKK